MKKYLVKFEYIVDGVGCERELGFYATNKEHCYKQFKKVIQTSPEQKYVNLAGVIDIEEIERENSNQPRVRRVWS